MSGCGELSLGFQYQVVRVTPLHRACSGQAGQNLGNRDNPQPTWLPATSSGMASWAVQRSLRCGCVAPPPREGGTCLRYGLRPPERVRSPTGLHRAEKWLGGGVRVISHSTAGTTELACGSQAFIATLLFDPSMSALPIIPKQNSVSVGLFTH